MPSFDPHFIIFAPDERFDIFLCSGFFEEIMTVFSSPHPETKDPFSLITPSIPPRYFPWLVHIGE